MTTSVRGYSQALWPTGEELDGTAYERSQLNGINVRSLVHELRQPLRELRTGADISKDSAPDQRKLDIRKNQLERDRALRVHRTPVARPRVIRSHSPGDYSATCSICAGAIS